MCSGSGGGSGSGSGSGSGIGSVATTVGPVALVSESDSPILKLAVSLALAEYRHFTA